MVDYLVLALGPVLIALVLWMFWASHNRLTDLDQRCATAFADIDVLLSERHSLIPPLVETVRGIAGHEQKVLTDVTRARAAAIAATGASNRLEAETQVGQCIASMFSIVESYPNIAASTHFSELQAELVRIEDRITAARRFYNLAVGEYNATKSQFPGNLTASMAKLAPRETFTLDARRETFDRPVEIRF